MYAGFPPLDHRSPASVPQAAFPRAYSGGEARTAGPMAARHIPENNDKTSHSTALGEQEADKGGWSFGDILDVINPLQHIPLVNLLYRGLTGDQIGGAAQIVGGGLFGGPIGALAGTASAIVSHQTGRSPSDVVAGAFNGDAPARAAHAYVDLSSPPVKRYNFNLKA